MRWRPAAWRDPMMQRAPNISVAEFQTMFESVKNWGRGDQTTSSER